MIVVVVVAAVVLLLVSTIEVVDVDVDPVDPPDTIAISAQFQNSSPNLSLLQQLFSQLAQLARIWGCQALASQPSSAIPR
mmetsp:Transcript_80785/g.98969  ORF Transcript_80785/g.98969 Transcript_80785/m.98969 type:complete len:80 (+) Transcript_80785:221-460(+)